MGNLPGSMDAPPSVSAEDLAARPSSVLALIHWLTARVQRLEAEVAELKARLNKDSTNSSLPPSATHPHAKPLPVRPKSKRRRGGQPGHDKCARALIPADQCQAVIPCVPSECRMCGRELLGVAPEPLRHQVWELPVIQP